MNLNADDHPSQIDKQFQREWELEQCKPVGTPVVSVQWAREGWMMEMMAESIVDSHAVPGVRSILLQVAALLAHFSH